MKTIILLVFATAIGMKEADESTLKGVGSKVSRIPPRRRLPELFSVAEVCSTLAFGVLIFYFFYATGLTLWTLMSFFMPWAPLFYQDWMRTRFSLDQRTAKILTLFQISVIDFVLFLLKNLNFYYALVDFIPHLATQMIILFSSIFLNRFQATEKLANSVTLIIGLIFLTSWMMPNPNAVEKAHFTYVNRDELPPNVQAFDFAKFWTDNCEPLLWCRVQEKTARKFVTDLETGAKGKQTCLALYGQWARDHGTRGPNQQIQAMCESFHPFPLARFKESLNVPKNAQECKRFFLKFVFKVHQDKCARCSEEQKGLLDVLFKYSEEYRNEMCPKFRNQKNNL